MPEAPLAFFITFRCYGTWLHGDVRGSTSWTPLGHQFTETARPAIERASRERMTGPPVVLNDAQRDCVARAIVETAATRGWALLASNVRTNHVHVVIVANGMRPEPVMNSLKSYGTRYLRDASLVASDAKLWSRHGSTRYLWDERQVENAIWYVVHGQSKPPD